MYNNFSDGKVHYSMLFQMRSPFFRADSRLFLPAVHAAREGKLVFAPDLHYLRSPENKRTCEKKDYLPEGALP